MDIKQGFGKRIKELRKARNLTQEQLAEMLNIEPPNVSRMESGLHLPKTETIETLRRIFNVPIYELFKFEHHNSRSFLVQEIEKFLKTSSKSDLEFVYKIIVNLLEYKKN